MGLCSKWLQQSERCEARGRQVGIKPRLMNETVKIYIQTFNLLCKTYWRKCLNVLSHFRSLTVVILANVEYSQRNSLQYYTVLYNISYLWNRFVAMETTLLIACSYTFAFVLWKCSFIVGIKRKKTPLNSRRTINLNFNTLFSRRMDMTFCMSFCKKKLQVEGLKWRDYNIIVRCKFQCVKQASV